MAIRLGEIEELTPREKDVLHYLVQGLSNRNIAAQLDVNERTVKAHVSAILAKLHAANRTQAVMLALEQGLAGLDDKPLS